MSILHLHGQSPLERRRDQRAPAGEARETDYLWCVVCEHAFHRQRFRRDGAQLRCPDPECEGGLMFEPWEWAQVRRANPAYPQAPRAEACYPYFGVTGAGDSQH